MTSEHDEFKNRWPFLRSAKVDEFGGVSQLGGFLKGCYEFISKDVPVISVFDGDEAGVKERTRLQSYFGKKQIRFESNKDYISVRSGFAIEGLFLTISFLTQWKPIRRGLSEENLLMPMM